MPILLVLVLLIIGPCLPEFGCPDRGDDWEYLGVCQTTVSWLDAPSAIADEDSLRLRLHAHVRGAEKVDLQRVDVLREGDCVEFWIWAYAWEWTGEGGGVMPPTDLDVHVYHSEPPPWLGDSIQVLVQQPEAPPFEHWVRVLH